MNFELQEVAVKKLLDQELSGAALAEFKREVSNELAFYICMWYSSLCFEEKKKLTPYLNASFFKHIQQNSRKKVADYK